MPTASSEGQRRTLGWRFFRQVAAISAGLVLAAGALEATFGYDEARAQMARLQALQAQAAAGEIDQYLQGLQRGLQLVQQLPWGQTGFDTRQRREELHRLLALQPALVEVIDLDGQGRERLFVSRRALDRVDAGWPAEGGLPDSGFSRARFDAEGTPQAQLVLAGPGDPAARTVALVNLRFLSTVASGLRLADGGEVYVIDAADQLVAHADPTQSLRKQDLQRHPLVVATRAALARGAPRLEAAALPGLLGGPSISTALALPVPGWLLVVEQPRTQAMAAVWGTLQRTLLLVAAAAGLAMLASAAFAHRMGGPIARLRAATAEMAAGQLQQPLDIRTGDELQGLAEDFNAMAGQLRRSYAELEQKVVERTAELDQRRAEAERANAAKTRFLASASHDLRQPMHAIGLLVGLLRERVSSADARDLTDKTHEAVVVMEGMFGSLLDISRLDAGAVMPQPQRLALQDLFDRVRRTSAPVAAARGLRLRVRPSRLQLHTDAALLERIVGNLVSNAIRYTPRGGVLVACRRRRGAVWLQVVDTGIGIAPAAQELVFDEFVRLGQSPEQGLGLGLSIVRRSAALLGLQVGLRSRVGHGSVFEIELTPALRDLPVQIPAPLLADDLRPTIEGTFVLVVDDDERNRTATAALLTQWGCLVAVAGHAEEALAEVRCHLRAPDLVLTDLRLGEGGDGRVLLQQLRAELDARLPALLVTADLSLPAPLEGDTRVLHKPVGSRRLMRALADALSDRAAGPA